jgi:capsular exopolysaccharide synthesis family protein
MIGITVLLGALAAYLFSSSRPQVWEATSTLFLSNANVFTGETIDVGLKVQQEASRVESYSVYDRASEILGGTPSRQALVKQVTVEADPAVGSLELTASSNDPVKAAEIANAVTHAYEELTRSAIQAQVEGADDVLAEQANVLNEEANSLAGQIQRDGANVAAERRLETVQTQLEALQTRMSEMTADAAIYGTGIADIEEAVPAIEPAGPKPIRDAAAAGLLILGLASAVAYWRAGSVVRARPDPTAVLGAPVLAQIPEFKQSPGGTAADSLFDPDVAEAYQFLLSSFEFVVAQTAAKSILVTSASPGDGKSLTALHLARALAVQGRGVILVDSDIRARGLTTLLNASGQKGLASLADGEDLNEVIRRYRISPSVRLSVVPAGPTPQQPTGLMATADYRDAIAKIIADNELTIIDGGPLLKVADASAIATQVDGILLVLDASTANEDLLKVRDRLRLVSTRLIGYIVNRVPERESTSHRYGRGESRRARRFRSND